MLFNTIATLELTVMFPPPASGIVLLPVPVVVALVTVLAGVEIELKLKELANRLNTVAGAGDVFPTGPVRPNRLAQLCCSSILAA